MLTFETINELTLKVTCSGNDVLYTKAGSFIAGESMGGKNYSLGRRIILHRQHWVPCCAALQVKIYH